MGVQEEPNYRHPIHPKNEGNKQRLVFAEGCRQECSTIYVPELQFQRIHPAKLAGSSGLPHSKKANGNPEFHHCGRKCNGSIQAKAKRKKTKINCRYRNPFQKHRKSKPDLQRTTEKNEGVESTNFRL